MKNYDVSYQIECQDDEEELYDWEQEVQSNINALLRDMQRLRDWRAFGGGR